MMMPPAILFGLAMLQSGPADSMPASAPATRPAAVSKEQVDRLISDLSHPRFTIRERATRQLLEIPFNDLSRLAHHYYRTTDYETRRRIRLVAESIFYRRQIADRCGFLGVSIATEVDRDLLDPSTGRLTPGVYVRATLPGHAADHAGLQANDVIIGIDDRPPPDVPETRQFIDLISRIPPGKEISLRILRPILQTRPIKLQHAEGTREPLEGVKLVAPPMTVNLGPRVTHITPGCAARSAGLQVNDIIQSVNGTPVMGPGGLATIQALSQVSSAGKTHILEVMRFSESLVRVTIGTRPIEHITPQDQAEARIELYRWWQEQEKRHGVPAESDQPDIQLRGPTSKGA